MMEEGEIQRPAVWSGLFCTQLSPASGFQLPAARFGSSRPAL